MRHILYSWYYVIENINMRQISTEVANATSSIDEPMVSSRPVLAQ